MRTSLLLALFAAGSLASLPRVARAQVTSTSGTSVSPALPPLVPPAATAPPPATPNDARLDARVKMLETRLDVDESLDRGRSDKLSWFQGLSISGFVQPQLLVQSYNSAASPNVGAGGQLPGGVGANDVVARGDGLTTNGTFFRVRRARLRTEYMPTDFARVVIEIDPAPIGQNGPLPPPATIARDIEAIGVAHVTDDLVTEYAAGIFKVPFGFEIGESSADRIFIERSWVESNLFPGEFDTGARASAWALKKKLSATVAVVNGVTLNEKAFAALPDLSKSKDVVGRVVWDLGLIAPGVSAYVGHGQNVDPSALRFKQFSRWAVNFEAALQHTFKKRIGRTRLVGEITRARNMDRGTLYPFALPPIPTPIGADVADRDELGGYVRLEQDITEWVTVGARWDAYTPDISVAQDSRYTWDFAAAVHFTKGLQLVAEYAHADDQVHLATAPAITKQIDTFSSVLQARF